MKILAEGGQKRFAIFAAVWGTIFTFLILPWQGPDEYSHIDMIGSTLGIYGFSDILKADMDLDEHRLRWNPNGREDGRIELKQVISAMFQKPDYKRSDCLPRGISIGIVSHLPAAVGMEIGILLGLPTYWVMILGRLCMLMVYIFLCSVALALMPMRKEVLEITMLLPMCMQQAASLSYDGVLLPVSFLFIAYIFYLKYEADRVGIREVLVSVLLLFTIAIAKIPYVVMGGLVLLIPVEKIDISLGRVKITGSVIHKARWLIVSACVAAVAGIVYIGRNNMYIRVVCASLANPWATIRLLGRTWIVWSEDIFLSFAGNFGWKDAPVGTWFVATVVALLLVTSVMRIADSDLSEYTLSIMDRVIICLVWVSCFYLVALSMVPFTVDYQSDDWSRTIRGMLAISGIQGRYFVPVVPLMMMIMPYLVDMRDRIFKRFISIWYVFACIYTSGVIIWRYWKL